MQIVCSELRAGKWPDVVSRKKILVADKWINSKLIPELFAFRSQLKLQKRPIRINIVKSTDTATWL